MITHSTINSKLHSTLNIQLSTSFRGPRHGFAVVGKSGGFGRPNERGALSLRDRRPNDLSWFVQQVHKLQRAAFQLANDIVNTGYQEVVGEHSQNTYYQIADGSYHRLIHTLTSGRRQRW